MSRNKSKFFVYAVAIGRQTGLFYSWDECLEHTKGFSGARFKKFESLEQAQIYLTNTSIIQPTTTTTTSANALLLPAVTAEVFVNVIAPNHIQIQEKEIWLNGGGPPCLRSTALCGLLIALDTYPKAKSFAINSPYAVSCANELGLRHKQLDWEGKDDYIQLVRLVFERTSKVQVVCCTVRTFLNEQNNT